MFRKLLSVRQTHDCEREQRYDPGYNRAIMHFGIIWQCPSCQAFWYRQVEFIEGLSRKHGTTPLWRRLTWLQTRKLRRLVEQGLSQLEITEHMNFKRPLDPGSLYNTTWKDDLERHMQDPSSWVFGRDERERVA